jgi:hypothetical protein
MVLFLVFGFYKQKTTSHVAQKLSISSSVGVALQEAFSGSESGKQEQEHEQERE